MTTMQTSDRPAAPTPTVPVAAAAGRRRSLPHLAAGALLVVVCAVAFAVTALRVDSRTAVLALARTVPAGHTLSTADLTVVHIVPDPALAVVAHTQQASVVGRTLRLPAAAGTLLSESMLGPAAWPPPQQTLVAVLVQPGRAPDGLVAGARVLVLVVPDQSSTSRPNSGKAQQAEATVVSVGTADGQGTTVVSLLTAAADAATIAGASGEVALVVQGQGG